MRHVAQVTIVPAVSALAQDEAYFRSVQVPPPVNGNTLQACESGFVGGMLVAPLLLYASGSE